MSHYDYDKIIVFLLKRAQQDYGTHFKIYDADKPVIIKLIAYFLKDEVTCSKEKIDLRKGILLSGPIGCGKTSLMTLMKYFNDSRQNIYIVKSCRYISFEFIKDGYEVIHRYTNQSFFRSAQNDIPKHYCFDDLGTENNLKYYGNECNVMAEVLLSRYDLFISRKLVTHLTTNLSASEIENSYGNRTRSRMREMFNLLSFNTGSADKRK